MMDKAPMAPRHLSDESRRWWREIHAQYLLEPHHCRLLQLAAEAWDRGQEARRALADAGSLWVYDKQDRMLPHPAVAVERDSAIRFTRIVRELALDIDAPGEIGRPPVLPMNANRRKGA